MSRWLLPFRAGLLSRSALDAALTRAAAAGAVLVPAYLALTPSGAPEDAPLPRECAEALPLLEAIDQLGARAGVPVEARIERGPRLQDALSGLLEHERHDRVLVAQRSAGAAGFEPHDVEWLRARTSADVEVLTWS